MSGEIAPRYFRWDAERSVMVPLNPKHADKHFVDGEQYRLGVVEERSTNSHNFYFAALNNAWENLPDALVERFPTSEHLRRHALVKAGYCNVQEFVAASKAEAVRLATFVRGIDEYAVVTITSAVVQRFSAKSQSYKAMGKAEFEASKTKVLEIVSEMIGVTPDALQKARAA